MQRIPITSKVADGRLYVGDLSDGRNAPDEIDVIVNVSQRTYEDSRMIHIPLKDSDEARERQLRHAIRTAADFVKDDISVLVHCAVGANRSATVAAAVLWEYDDGVGAYDPDAARKAANRIKSVRPIVNLSPHYRDMLVRYVEQQDLPTRRPDPGESADKVPLRDRLRAKIRAHLG